MELCCYSRASRGHREQEDLVSLDLFQERNAMILGMNPAELRKPRNWFVHIWHQKQHWSLVLRPQGEPFLARVVDDFVHEARHCYSAEVASMRFFLVYEVLVDSGKPYLMLSVKTDFDPDRECMQSLGVIGPASIVGLEQCAQGIVSGLSSYNFTGRNWHRFATEFAVTLGAPWPETPWFDADPDDDPLVRCASEAAMTVGAAGAMVACAAAQPTAVGSVAGLAIQGIAAGAGGLAFVGSLVIVGAVAGYKTVYGAFRGESQGHCIAKSFSKQLEDGNSGNSAGMVESNGISRLVSPLASEPEGEPACDLEDVSPTTLQASMLGGSRVAPWSSAPSWEQPPWTEMQEADSERARDALVLQAWTSN